MLIIRFLILTFLITACGNSTEFKESPIPRISGGFALESLTFKNIREQILEPHCLKCHLGYKEYEVVFDQKEAILEAIIQGRMPKNSSALDDQLKGLIIAWVGQGAPLGTGNIPPGQSKLEPTWDSLSKKIIFPKCVQCHNPQGQASFLDLSTRQKFFEQRDELLNNFDDVENSYLIEVLTDPDEPMPPQWANIERLKDREIKVLIEWIKQGLP